MQTPDETLQPPPALQPLAMRMARRNQSRAERLARRLRDPAWPEPSEPSLSKPVGLAEPPACFAEKVALRRTPSAPRLRGEVDPEAAAALAEFLRLLIDRAGPADPGPGRAAGGKAAPAQAASGKVLSFQRTAWRGSEPCDLDSLPGTGPGLVWALRRAGVDDLGVLARLEPEDLAARLGPLGRLVPARAWIATAKHGQVPESA
jgi:hypothetical protein